MAHGGPWPAGEPPAREVWRAPAKINLWLEISGQRADGYHFVDTGYQAIDLADTVILESSGGHGLSCVVEGPASDGVPAGDANLAARAARVIAERTGHQLKLALTIVKEIPAGAGLGGGSSDAAAVLMALAHRFAIPDPEHTLVELAAELGADVPFFLRGGTQRATGIGDRLRPMHTPSERWGTLVYPGLTVSTKWAYETYDRRAGRLPAGAADRSREAEFEGPAGKIDFEQPAAEIDWRSLRNVFESLVFKAYPVVAHVAGLLQEGGAEVVRMSGTGGGVFALYSSEALRNEEITRVRGDVVAIPAARIWPFAFVDRGVRAVGGQSESTARYRGSA